MPVGAGGATDILSRALAQRLSAFWEHQVVVDNRPGGGSNVGFEVAARAPADGSLAVTSAQRSALIPGLPTFAEGGLRGYDVTGWYGVVAPVGTLKEIIERLNAEFTRALASPDVIQTLSASGLEPVTRNTPEEFAAYLRAEISKWAKVLCRPPGRRLIEVR